MNARISQKRSCKGAGIFMLRFTRQHIKETAIILAIVIFIGTLWFLGYKRHIRDTINQAYDVTPISAIQLQLASSSKADKLMIDLTLMTKCFGAEDIFMIKAILLCV